MGLCFTLCIDYPACTSTTPLIVRSAQETASGKTEYQLLVRCGMLATWNDTDSTGWSADIRARGADGSPQAICRNVVDTFAPKPGVVVRSVVPPKVPSLQRYIKLQAFTRDVERAYDDEVVISGHDLFSHWLFQPITFRQWQNSSSNGTTPATAAGPQALVVPTGSEYSDVYKRYNWRAVYDQLKAGGSLAQLVGERPFQRLITGAWVVSPDARGALQATYIVQVWPTSSSSSSSRGVCCAKRLRSMLHSSCSHDALPCICSSFTTTPMTTNGLAAAGGCQHKSASITQCAVCHACFSRGDCFVSYPCVSPWLRLD
jgi:hypothetical protein